MPRDHSLIRHCVLWSLTQCVLCGAVKTVYLAEASHALLLSLGRPKEPQDINIIFIGFLHHTLPYRDRDRESKRVRLSDNLFQRELASYLVLYMYLGGFCLHEFSYFPTWGVDNFTWNRNGVWSKKWLYITNKKQKTDSKIQIEKLLWWWWWWWWACWSPTCCLTVTHEEFWNFAAIIYNQTGSSRSIFHFFETFNWKIDLSL